MEINIPEIVAEVTAAWEAYQKALGDNDLDKMGELFWNSPSTVRFGPNGTLIGHDAISGYRQARVGPGPVRQTVNTVITTFGRDFAATNTEVRRPGMTIVGRQSQAWIRTPEGWRIVSAHVSDQPQKP